MLVPIISYYGEVVQFKNNYFYSNTFVHFPSISHNRFIKNNDFFMDVFYFFYSNGELKYLHVSILSRKK